MTIRNVIKVFLASPSDLKDERLAAKAQVDEFNRLWADHLGYQIELIGWEDTVSAAQRPQQAINKELDKCEYVIGMLWKRWGTPPDNTGSFSSGFEEEFKRSHSRNKETGTPSISLFIKEIDEDSLKDPGDQLKEVIKFKASIIDGKEVLYETFSSIQEFEKKFLRAITSYVQDLMHKEHAEDEAGSSHTVQGEDGQLGGFEGANGHPFLSKEGAEFLSTIVKSETDHKRRNPQLDVAIFRLIGCSAQVGGNDEQTLGVHDSNVVYRFSSASDFGRREISSLIDAGLANIRSETVPLWSWYSKAFPRGGGLGSYSVYPADDIRAGALTAMTMVGETPSLDGGLSREAYVARWISSEDDNVRSKALAYLAKWGEPADLIQVRAEVEKNSYQTRGAAADAYIRIKLRIGSEHAASALIELQSDVVNDDLIREIYRHPASITADTLQAGLDHRKASVRLSSLRSLALRGLLSQIQTDAALTDSDAEVRLAALTLLESTGRVFSDAEAKAVLDKTKPATLFGSLGTTDTSGSKLWEKEKYRRLLKLTEAQLTDQIEASLPLDLECFIARSDSFFKKHGNDLRGALREGFSSVYRAACDRWEKGRPDDLSQRIRKLEDSICVTLTRSALDVVEGKQDPRDLMLVREVLKRSDLLWSRRDAEYLRKNGEWSDIELLSDLTERQDSLTLWRFGSDDHRYVMTASAIVALHGERTRELLRLSINAQLLAEVISQLGNRQFRSLSYADIKPLLLHKDTNVRRKTAQKVISTFAKKDVKEFLSNYVEADEARFYNVIYWLDFGASMAREQVRIALSHN